MNIGVDHGYYAIKTRHFSFPAGITAYRYEPYTLQNTLEYQGKYYVCGTGRQPILRNKMENDNYYLLTLAAIAKEIQQRGEKRECAVNLGAGLPLAGFGREKKAFREYLLRSSQPVSFKFEGISYQVTIQDVRLFPQGCSAIAVHPEFIQGEPSVLLMDIGGWTVDLMRLDNGIPNASTCRSLELGMIRCIDEAKEQVRRETGLSVTDAQVERESISGNVTKGIRMGYENGRFSFRYTNCLGYRKGADGKPEIHPEEAKTIRMIFENFLNGDSIDDIKQCLENKGILTPTGHTEWILYES